MNKLVLITVVVLFLYGCSSVNDPEITTNCLESKVFFGLSINNQIISEAEWQSFLDSEIVTRFPNGFTIISSQGFWRYCDTCPTSSEPSKILILDYPLAEKQKNQTLIQEISDRYKHKYQQQFVLTSTAEVYCNLGE